MIRGSYRLIGHCTVGFVKIYKNIPRIWLNTVLNTNCGFQNFGFYFAVFVDL